LWSGTRISAELPPETRLPAQGSGSRLSAVTMPEVGYGVRGCVGENYDN
jgi:hypothetical protein